MSGSDVSDLLKSMPLLQGISAESMATLHDCVTVREFPANQVLLLEDAWGNTFYLLASGWIKIRRSTQTGTAILAVLGAPTFFGEIAILDQAPRSTDVVALTSVTTLVIPAQQFKRVLLKEGILGYRIAEQMARRLRHANQFFYLRQQSPPVRFVAVLVQIADNYGKPISPDTMEIGNIPIDDLASLAEIAPDEARAAVNRFLQQHVIEIDHEKQVMRLNQYQKLVEAVQSA